MSWKVKQFGFDSGWNISGGKCARVETDGFIIFRKKKVRFMKMPLKLVSLKKKEFHY